MPRHHEPFFSLSHVSRHCTRHSSLAGGADGAAALSVPIHEYFQDGAPHISNHLFLFSFIHLGLHQCHLVRPISRMYGQHRKRGGEYAHQERLLGHGTRQKRREQRLLRFAVAPWASSHSAVSPQADDSVDDLDSTEIVAGSSYDGSVAAAGALVLTCRRRRGSNDNHCSCNCNNNISSSNPRLMWGCMMRSSCG